MSFSIRNNFCHKCGKPLSVFEQGLCVECETAEKAEQGKCEHNCEDCEHNDGECCRILFERSFEQLRTEVERATIEMDYETAQEALAVIDRHIEQEPKVTTTSTDEPMVIQYTQTDEPMVMQYPQVDGITPTVVRAEQEPTDNMPCITPEEMQKCKDIVKKYTPKQEPRDVFDEYGNYKYPSDVELTEPNTATSTPCDDVVSRQAVINLVRGCNSALEEPRIFNSHNSGVVFEHYINELPSVRPQEQTKEEHIDVFEVVNTPWIYLDNCANSGYYCPKCKKKLVKDGWSETVKKINFCPNCGAKMVEQQEEKDKE